MQRIALVYNPRAADGKSYKMLQSITSLLSERSLDYAIFSDSWPDSFRGFTDVWIIGGDGTLNYFINKYPAIIVPLVIFPGGTGNDFSWSLYGNMTTEKMVDRALSSSPKPVDVIECNGKLFLNAVGIGFDGAVLKDMKWIRRIGGHLGYLLVVLKNVFTYREKQFTVQAENEVLNERFLLVMVANSRRTGGGFKVAPYAEINDGLMDLILVKPLNILQRLLYLPIIERGRHMDLKCVQYIKSGKLKIRSIDVAEGQIDGDNISGKTFDFSVKNGHFYFKY